MINRVFFELTVHWEGPQSNDIMSKQAVRFRRSCTVFGFGKDKQNEKVAA